MRRGRIISVVRIRYRHHDASVLLCIFERIERDDVEICRASART
jgi:hypothetical protein